MGPIIAPLHLSSHGVANEIPIKKSSRFNPTTIESCDLLFISPPAHNQSYEQESSEPWRHSSLIHAKTSSTSSQHKIGVPVGLGIHKTYPDQTWKNQVWYLYIGFNFKILDTHFIMVEFSLECWVFNIWSQ